MSIKTAETYRARLATKLGSRSRADFVRYAIRAGLFDTGGAEGAGTG